MHIRSLLLGLAVTLACTTGPDDGAGSTGTGASTGPASAADESGATSPTTGDPTSGGPVTDSAATGASSETGESGGAGTTGAAVSFTEVYEQVLLANGCNAGYCHGGGAGGLEMTDEATSYANLVEVTATAAACGQSVRVVPGSLEASILWYRVRPAAQDDGGMACAPKMPQGSMGLPDDQAKLVSDWISGGALE